MRIHHLLTYLFIVVLMMSCGKKEQDVYLFDLLGPEQTGIQFTNKLTPRGDLNMLPRKSHPIQSAWGKVLN